MSTSRRRALTPKQAAFVREYLVDLNATGAAKRAGYSNHTATRAGYANMQKPHVATQIARAMAERAERTQVTADQVIQELAKIAFANLGDLITIDKEGGVTFKAKAIEGEAATALAKISRSESGRLRLGLHSKLRALELLGKHLGIFVERHDITSGGQRIPFTGIGILPRDMTDEELERALRHAGLSE